MQKWRRLFSTEVLPLNARHNSSGLNSRFNGGQLSFSDYVATSLEMVRKIRKNDKPDTSNKVIAGNAPFELEPHGSAFSGKQKKYRRGILLTHGLSDSPYFMRYLARDFQENGFRVMAVLLPGHGTQPGDLLDVTWQEWEMAVAYGTDRLAAEVDEVYLGGYSAGGALSILQSLHDKRVLGLYLFAPALEIACRAAYANMHKIISWLLPRHKWVYIKPDKDLYKYESFAKNTAAQMYALTRALNLQLQKHPVLIPIFAVASEDDKTVCTKAIIKFMAQQANPSNRLVLYTTEEKKILQNTASEYIEWVYSVMPEQGVLSSAHTAILLPSSDEHYGTQGDYVNCVHYFPEHMDKYIACKKSHATSWLGELTEKNLQTGIVRRLMYNPNFGAMINSLRQFMNKLL